MLTEFKTDDLISVKGVNNARGYPVTGKFVEHNPDDKTAKVILWGLYGPGSETLIHDIDIKHIKLIETWNTR